MSFLKKLDELKKQLEWGLSQILAKKLFDNPYLANKCWWCCFFTIDEMDILLTNAMFEKGSEVNRLTAQDTVLVKYDKP